MEEDLHLAACFGRRKEVLDLLAAGADINAKVPHFNDRTALMAAAGRGRLEMVRLLLAYGVDVHLRDDVDRTAMDHATFWRHIAVIRLLWDANSPRSIDSFYAAALLGNTQAVLELLAETPDRMPEALFYAAAAGKPQIIAALLKQGGDIQQTFTRLHYSLLHVAAGYGQNTVVRFLIKQGARIDAQDDEGCTTLMYIIPGFGEESHKNPVKALKTLRYLLEAGTKVDVPDDTGMTALMMAVDRNKLDFARVFLEFGADTSLTDANGRTALMIAQEKNRPDFVTLLTD